MFVEQMTVSECLDVLGRSRLGRLACARDNQPYVVPIYFVYGPPYLYGFTTLGQKIEWMRTNPLVCVEVDEVIGTERWLSVVIFGRYEELSETPEEEQHRLGEQLQERLHERDPARRPAASGHAGSLAQRDRLYAHRLLQENPEWWEPGYASAQLRDTPAAIQPVFYRIHIDRITGRRATPGAPAG